MNVIEIIDKKRRGLTHTPEEIHHLVHQMMSGQAHDYQVAAWLMAVCIQGLDLDETTELTRAFVQSGNQLDLSGIEGVVVDKHSTGGVGDKTTLALIPLLATAGVKIAKLSGRGLGFTGGTIDKLEAIPGFQVSLSNAEFVRQIQDIGMAISSQTSDLAPADGKMYALRDVTATVASIPLIAASVISKKIAAGAHVIVLDIKYGQGAFMKTLDDAKALATTCREVGQRLGRSISTVISSMDQPLGQGIGHSLEVLETVQMLKGQGPSDLETLCLTLGAVTLVGAGTCPSLEAGQQQLKQTIHNGQALQLFKTLITTQHGRPDFIDTPACLPHAAHSLKAIASQSGHVGAIDSLKVAQAAKLVGAGRLHKDEAIDLAVGVVLHKKVGDVVQAGETLAVLHANQPEQPDALHTLQTAFQLSPEPVEPPALIEEIILGAPIQRTVSSH